MAGGDGAEKSTGIVLSYYRARYYDPGPGRFLSEDPSSFLSGGINFYGYVENSPLGFKDPNGLQAQPSGACCDDKKIKQGLQQVQDAFASAAATKSAVFQKYAKWTGGKPLASGH